MKQDQITRLKLLIGRFKQYMELEGFSGYSVRSYLLHLKIFAGYLESIDIEEINQITKETIYQFQLYLYNYRDRRDKPLLLNTQIGVLVALKCFFRFLVKKEYFLYDPTSIIEMPRKMKALPRVIMTKKEVNKILNKPDADTVLGLRDKAMLELMYSTGIRNFEIRNLTVYDIDIQNNELRINLGKGKKDRVVPIGEISAKYIDEYINISRPYLLDNARKLYKVNPGEVKVLFVTKGGRKFTEGLLNHTIKKYVNCADVNKRITAHSFRHTFATHMLKGRANIRYIQQLLGHKDISTTQIYTRVEVGDLKKELKKCHPREQPARR